MKSAILLASSASALMTVQFVPEFEFVVDSTTHYGQKPCLDDEVSVSVQGVDGDVCTSKCTGALKNKCPTDVPAGVTAHPQCALQDPAEEKYCVLICSPDSNDDQCGAGASCKSVGGAGICTNDGDLEFHEIHAAVKASKTTWTSTPNPKRFNNTDDVKQLLGTWLSDDPRFERLPEFVRDTPLMADEDLPDSFDARTAWPECTVISKVRDQSSCGSCWAFGSTESFEDRHCIATGKNVEFSAYDTAACCSGIHCGFSQGCNGGQPTSAWKWFTTEGVVTGGDFSDVASGETCLPYPFEACAHHVDSDKYPACPKAEYSTQCKATCEASYSGVYKTDKVKAKSAYSVSGIDNMKKELVTNGPLAVAFNVYSDFPTYTSGVYQKGKGVSALGGHAVELIGYGTEDGLDYWLCKNSWNEEWGDGGTFKIAHGECGIEQTVSGGTF